MSMRACALVLLAGVIVRLDHLAIQDALAIANSSIESTHRRFHADYHFPVNRAPVDFVSIVSPFRRVVLSAETAASAGRRIFGQREAVAAIGPDTERFEVYVELTFHPHNTFIGVPEYTVEMEPATSRGSTVVPREMDRLPRFGPRLDDTRYPFPYPHPAMPRSPSGSEPLLGGTLIARFEGGRLDPEADYFVIVRDAGKEMARAKVDLGRLR
jgi:hypothetical protein